MIKMDVHISASQVQMYRPSLISSFKAFKVSLFLAVLIRVCFFTVSHEPDLVAVTRGGNDEDVKVFMHYT